MKHLSISILSLFILFGCVRADLEEPAPTADGQTRGLTGDSDLSSDYYCFEDQKIPLFPSDKSYKLYRALNDKMPMIEGKPLAAYSYAKEMDSLGMVYEAVVENAKSKTLQASGLQEIYSMPCYKNSDGEDVAISNLFYVFLNEPSDEEYLRELSKANGVIFTGEDPVVPLFYTLVCNASSRGNSLEMANLFHETGMFAAVAPDFMGRKPASADPLYPQQWNLKNVGQIVPSQYDETYKGKPGIDLGYELVKPYIPASSDVIVAVIDTGVESNHPDFKVYDSWDAMNAKSPCQIWNNDKHGTECAGLIAATPDNGIGLAGIAPNAKIMAISIPIGWSKKSELDKSIVRAFNYAVDNGASVISNSWCEGSYSETVKYAMKKALFSGRKRKGCVVVFASGNGGRGNVSPPGNFFRENLCVGGIDPTGKRVVEHVDGRFYWGSNFGMELDVVAPGTAVPTTNLGGRYNPTYTGTSAACPQVAAIAALVLSVDPDLTRQQVNDIIEMTATKVGSYDYFEKPTRNNGLWSNDVGYGMASAYKAVMAASKHFDISDRTISDDDYYYCQNFTLCNVTVTSSADFGLSATTGFIKCSNLDVSESAQLSAKAKSRMDIKGLTVSGSAKVSSASEGTATLERVEVKDKGRFLASASDFRINSSFRVEKGSEFRLEIADE